MRKGWKDRCGGGVALWQEEVRRGDSWRWEGWPGINFQLRCLSLVKDHPNAHLLSSASYVQLESCSLGYLHLGRIQKFKMGGYWSTGVATGLSFG